MIVSGIPLYRTVTFTVKGTLAVVEEGAVKFRVACGVAQLDDNIATTTRINAR